MVKYDYSIKDDLKLTFTQKKIILITVFSVAGVLSDLLATSSGTTTSGASFLSASLTFSNV